MQSRVMSLVETTLSTAIGFIVAVLTQMLVFPIWGLSTTFADDLGIAAIFTVVSIIRGYWVRRLFNWLHVRSKYEIR